MERDLLQLITDAMVRSEVEEIDRPHVVIARDQSTGSQWISGPYVDALAAAVAVEHERHFDRTIQDSGRAYSVAPLLEPFVGDG